MGKKVIAIVVMMLVFKAFESVCEDVTGYLGQIPPGTKAEIFAPGIVSQPNTNEYTIVFSPDMNECYFSQYDGATLTICFLERKDGVWTEPVVAPSPLTPGFNLSSLSPDGERLFLEKDGDIWVAERKPVG